MEPYELSASEAARLIASRDLSCEELARSTLARIAERDPIVRAWTYIDEDRVLRRARELDKTAPVSPLHGLTFGIKDVIQTADMPTQQNSSLYVDHRSGQDAACVAVVRHSGALVVGKTETVEFAAGGRMPATRNPSNLAHTPGGTSSGSAAAVADHQVQLAFGTQTAGSHIRPAAFNGIYGIKPTHGVVSREGAKLYAHSLDTIGWYGRSADDLALVAEAFALPGMSQRMPVPLKGLRVGLCMTASWSAADPYAQAALMQTAFQLESAGAIVKELTLPAPFNDLPNAHETVLYGEGRAAFLSETLGPKAHMLGSHFRDIAANARGITPQGLAAAYDLAAACRRQFDALFDDEIDVVLTPASPGEAPEGFTSTGNYTFNIMWTLLHVPCVAMPVGRSPRNLPLGVQLVGPRTSDARLLEIARACAPALDSNAAITLS
ncbi:amidase [Bordetella sp. 15P40C-2]|uniref:amidase n=1 Tax=Bordetella sp. 15P40C-2 TaxID=2572246 RepID=UPI00132C4AAD|nr:amidase [Bordetella sp. 15P40C-2]MVW70373.1 amidase [Bordetella sp. 15P40C-2]